ncbi:MAG: hypothetical protein U0235_24710 [Polyangiaceae bacterium]
MPRLAGARADRLKFAPDLVTGLVMHGWPLNVRELEHVLSVALVTSKEDLLKLADVGDGMLRALRTSEPPKERESHDPERRARDRHPLRDRSPRRPSFAHSLVEALLTHPRQRERDRPRDGQDAHADPPLDEALRARPESYR